MTDKIEIYPDNIPKVGDTIQIQYEIPDKTYEVRVTGRMSYLQSKIPSYKLEVSAYKEELGVIVNNTGFGWSSITECSKLEILVTTIK